MKIDRMISAVLLAGLAGFLMDSSASASTITYSTNGSGTGFGGANLSLTSSTGGATLTFNPNVNSVTGVPSNINFGTFTLLCSACSTQAAGMGATFGAFTFDLVITDITDGATGRFVGSSTGGAVFSDVSQLTVIWEPLQIGPFDNNALTGSFGATSFSTKPFTGIVAPNSGAIPGQSTVEGYVNFLGAGVDVITPEPSTFALLGAALFGVGIWRRTSSSL
jgi:hypothetical protein